ncbi:J domain-containing protein [Cognatiluteimonas profundi]|uniref:J domain-containing protein n=1 Tax=Cognatiluteimonas profundi TaxID=2594501 RepID=UPI00131BAC84|nr:DnaJ domain-containing protein [Lysobacter profundi]
MNRDGVPQRWYGKVIGLVAGFLLLRVDPLLGALIGLLLGHAVDAGWFAGRGHANPEHAYRVLGLTADASDSDIDLARRRLIAQHHPDRAADEASRKAAERRTREINAAYARIRKLRR